MILPIICPKIKSASTPESGHYETKLVSCSAMPEPRRHQFPQKLRIRKRGEFKRLQAGTRKLHSAHLLVIMNPSLGANSRIGITVTTRVDKRATQRNRIKRIVRETFRLLHHQVAGTFDIVVIARQNATDCSSASLREELVELLRKNRYLSDG